MIGEELIDDPVWPMEKEYSIEDNPYNGLEMPRWNWVVIGAETGNRKGKIIPERVWIESIVNECRKDKVPVFLKNSLTEIWGVPLIQEYPWVKG